MFQPAAFLDHDRLILLEQGCEIPDTVLNFHDVGEMLPRLNVTVVELCVKASEISARKSGCCMMTRCALHAEGRARSTLMPGRFAPHN